VPKFVARVDTALVGQLGDLSLGGVPTVGRAGLGFTYVPGRPLPFKETGDPMYLTNLGAEVRLHHVSVGLVMRNLLKLRYRQSEFNYASSFAGPNVPPSRVPERHFVAGDPFFAMATVTVHVEDLMRFGLRPAGDSPPASAEGEASNHNDDE
jgi:hypothetical protein